MVTLPYFTDVHFDQVMRQELQMTRLALASERNIIFRTFPCLMGNESRRVLRDKRYRFLCWFIAMCEHWNTCVTLCSELDDMVRADLLAENEDIMVVAHAVFQLEALKQAVSTQITLAEHLTSEFGPMGTAPATKGRHVRTTHVKELAMSLERTAARLRKLYPHGP
ncbi:MAG: hypothetical protein WC813_02180 [Patescibacteria group bacterium]|jgi:hypothetical protein